MSVSDAHPAAPSLIEDIKHDGFFHGMRSWIKDEFSHRDDAAATAAAAAAAAAAAGAAVPNVHSEEFATLPDPRALSRPELCKAVSSSMTGQVSPYQRSLSPVTSVTRDVPELTVPTGGMPVVQVDKSMDADAHWRSQWVIDAIAGAEQRQEALGQEICAVREATAVGAAALIELREAVKVQLESLVQHVQRLDQDLAATNMELAEVVIDKETNEGALKIEVDGLRSEIDESIAKTRGQFHELHVTVRESLEQQVAETRQAADKECEKLRQLLDNTMQRAEAMRDAVIKGLEDRLEAGTRETHDLFYKIDKVMHGETSGVVQKQGVVQKVEHLMKEKEAWEQHQEHSQRDVQELQREARKFQEQQDKLEPRVLMIEEAQRNSEARAERIQDQVRNLLASRFSSPADEKNSEPASAGSSGGDARGGARSDSVAGAQVDDEGDAWRWDSRNRSFSKAKTEPNQKDTGIGRSPSADHSNRAPAPDSKRATRSVQLGANQNILQATQAFRSAAPPPAAVHQAHAPSGSRSPPRPTQRAL